MRTSDIEMRRGVVLWALALSLLFSGCGLLERSWSSVQPHSAVYWEDKDTDTLRAESYQDLVNALLLLVGDHTPSGAVRVYGMDAAAWDGMAERACNEVQQETALGAYLLEYITFSETTVGKEYREVQVTFGYRRTREEHAALLYATTVEAIPDLLRTAAGEGAASLTVQLGEFSSNEQELAGMVDAVRQECGAPSPWPVVLYPSASNPGIAEIMLES